MKRFFVIAAAAVLAMATLSSCKKDNAPREFGYAVVTAEYHINDVFSRIADVSMNLTKMDGSKTSMPVTTTAQVVDIDKYSGTVPAVFSFSFDAKSNGSASESDSYAVELVYKFTIKVYDSTGKLVMSDAASETFKQTPKGGALTECFNYLNKTCAGKFEVGSDLKITK